MLRGRDARRRHYEETTAAYCRCATRFEATDHVRGESTDGRLGDDRLCAVRRTQTNNMINDARLTPADDDATNTILTCTIRK